MIATLKNRAIRVLIGAWLPLLIIWVWWTWSANANDPFFPPLSVIWEDFRYLWVFDNVPTHLVPTLRNIFLGLAIGASAGVVIGAHLALSGYATRAAMPIIHFLRSIPPIALVPIFIVFFGIETEMRVALISFVTLFPVMLATMQAVRSTDETLVDTTRAFRFSAFRTLWQVRLRAGLPQLFASLQLAVQIAFLVAIAAEILGAGLGLGAFTKLAQDSFQVVDMWTGVVLMGLVGYGLFLALEIVEHIALRWYYGARRLEK